MLVYLGKRHLDERPFCLTFSYSFARLPHSLVSGTKMACEEWVAGVVWGCHMNLTITTNKMLLKGIKPSRISFFSDTVAIAIVTPALMSHVRAEGSFDFALMAYHVHHKHLVTWLDTAKGFKVRYTLRKNIGITWISAMLPLGWFTNLGLPCWEPSCKNFAG